MKQFAPLIAIAGVTALAQRIGTGRRAAVTAHEWRADLPALLDKAGLPFGDTNYVVRYRAVDGTQKVFATPDIKKARAWAQEWNGEDAAFAEGAGYAVSTDGMSTVEIHAQQPDGSLINLGYKGLRLLWPKKPHPTAVAPSKDWDAVQRLKRALVEALEVYAETGSESSAAWALEQHGVLKLSRYNEHRVWYQDKNPDFWATLKGLPGVRPRRTRMTWATWKRRDWYPYLGEDRRQQGGWFSEDLTFTDDLSFKPRGWVEPPFLAQEDSTPSDSPHAEFYKKGDVRIPGVPVSAATFKEPGEVRTSSDLVFQHGGYEVSFRHNNQHQNYFSFRRVRFLGTPREQGVLEHRRRVERDE